MNRFIIFFLRQYQYFLSPLLPPSCRFVPSCSEYAIEAFQKKSVLKATAMTLIRLAKCHPFHPGGFDPVR